MVINNRKINKMLDLDIVLRSNILFNIDDGDDGDLERICKIKYKIYDKILFLNILSKYRKNKNSFILFINSNNFNDKFDLHRLDEFIKYVKNNPKDRSSKTYIKLRFDNIDNEYTKKYKMSLYDKMDIKYGIDKSKSIKDDYVKKQRSKSKRCIEYWVNKGYDLDEADKKLKEYQSSHLSKHFSNKSDEYISNYKRLNSPWCIEHYINKGLDIKDAKDIISDIKRKSNMFGLEYYISRGYSIEKSIDMRNDFYIKNKPDSMVSKESLKLFNPIIDRINDKYDNIKIYCGDPNIKENMEYFLHDRVNNRFFFYDFTLIYNDIKLIIEYNGTKFHPNRNEMNDIEWSNWRVLFDKEITADMKYEYDQYKKQFALDNKFKYLTIWSSNNYSHNYSEIEKFLNDNNIII